MGNEFGLRTFISKYIDKNIVIEIQNVMHSDRISIKKGEQINIRVWLFLVLHLTPDKTEVVQVTMVMWRLKRFLFYND